MRTSTAIVTALGGGLLATTVVAATLTTPPDGSAAAVRVLQSAALPSVATTAAPDAGTTPGTPDGPAVLAASTDPQEESTARPAPPPLTDDQKGLVDEYLAAHPGRAQHLADVAARWKAFADANPELAAELARAAAMAPDERRAELRSWFADHPEQKERFAEWVKQTHDQRVERRQDRRDHRQDRRERRHERWQNRHDGRPAPTPAPTASGSVFAPHV